MKCYRTLISNISLQLTSDPSPIMAAAKTLAASNAAVLGR